MSATGIILGTVASAGLSALNNWMASRQSDWDRSQNYFLNEEAAKEAYYRQREMYKDFYSPEALMRQYKEAGLSPSLMFGGTPGQGGMAAPQGAGVAGLKTPFMPLSMLEAAQIANIEAQTEKTRTETKEMKGETEKGWAIIQNILAEVGLKDAETAVNKAEAAGISLDNYVKEHTKDASITMICAQAEQAGYDAEKAFQELRNAKVLADVNQATYEEQVQLKKKEVEALAQSITESKATVRLKDQERRKMYNDILYMWEYMDIQWKELSIDQQQADTYTDWINAQIPKIEEQLKIRFKELDLEKTELIIDAVTGTIKSLAFGAMAASSFKGGQSGLIQPDPKKVLKTPYEKMNTNARKYRQMKNKELYGL